MNSNEQQCVGEASEALSTLRPCNRRLDFEDTAVNEAVHSSNGDAQGESSSPASAIFRLTEEVSTSQSAITESPESSESSVPVVRPMIPFDQRQIAPVFFAQRNAAETEDTGSSDGDDDEDGNNAPLPRTLKQLEKAYGNDAERLLRCVDTPSREEAIIRCSEAGELCNKIYARPAGKGNATRIFMQCTHCKEGSFLVTKTKGSWKLRCSATVPCKGSCKGRLDKTKGCNYKEEALKSIIANHDASEKDSLMKITDKKMQAILKLYVRGAAENITQPVLSRVRKRLREIFMGDSAFHVRVLPSVIDWLNDNGYIAKATYLTKEEYKVVYTAQAKKRWDADQKSKERAWKKLPGNAKKKKGYKRVAFDPQKIDPSVFAGYSDDDKILESWGYVNPLMLQSVVEGGFDVVQKVTACDATHGRNNTTLGTFFQLCVRNAERNILPIFQGWSVYNEGNDTWKQFFRMLPEPLRLKIQLLVSDGEKGITNAAQEVLGPDAKHFTCINHRRKNGLKTGIAARDKKTFQKMLEETSKAEVKKMKRSLTKKSQKWLSQLGGKPLSDEQQFPAFAPHFQGTFTQSFSESLNAQNLKNGNLDKNPATALIAFIECEVDYHNKLRRKYQSSEYIQAAANEECTDAYKEHARAMKKKAEKLICATEVYERNVLAACVYDASDKGLKHRVVFNGDEPPRCDCGEPDVMRRICAHGACLVIAKGAEPWDFCFAEDLKSTCVAEYSRIAELPVPPVRTMEEHSNIKMPHLGIRRRGRKRKMQRTSHPMQIARDRRRRRRKEANEAVASRTRSAHSSSKLISIRI